MAHKRITSVLFAVFAAAAARAALPAPLATNALQAVDAAALSALNGGEVSCGFHVRFDKLPSPGSPTANCAIAAGDFNAARTVLDMIVAGSKGATNDFVRIRLGRIAWAERDYEGVVAFYPPVDSPLNIREQYPMEDRANVAKALKLLGREEEELRALEDLKNKADRNWKSYYAFAYDRLKARLGKLPRAAVAGRRVTL